MGNFLISLGKGLVRSAVNQVGRDGGRVISNQIYGNAHSVPIRNVAPFKQDGILENTEIPANELRESAIKNGYKVRLCTIPLVSKILGSIFLFPLFIILPLIYLIAGIVKLFKKNTILFKTEVVPIYVNDKRYKTGIRHSGYKNEEITIELPATSIEKNKYRVIGLIYIIVSCLMFLLQILLLEHFQ